MSVTLRPDFPATPQSFLPARAADRAAAMSPTMAAAAADGTSLSQDIVEGLAALAAIALFIAMLIHLGAIIHSFTTGAVA